MVFFVRITVNQSHLRPICKSTKFNPKIQRTIYSINFQRLRLHVLDFIRTVVNYNNEVGSEYEPTFFYLWQGLSINEIKRKSNQIIILKNANSLNGLCD